ncbi:MAG TPA: hypothetical protein VLI69_06960 [Gammaproteobacteria bacterium]|nr:hypothetical protein [Gammaproteobacteria bacterium]
MTSSQKKFDTDEQVTVPVDVVNTILEYEGSDILPGHAAVSLVSTLFNCRKTRLRNLLTASVSGKPNEAKAILERDPSLRLDKLEEECVIAPTGHKFKNLYPLQAALSVDDTQMAEMIRSIFVKLNDEKEADYQYEECQKGWEADQKKWEPIIEQRKKLELVVRDGKEDITSTPYPDCIVTVAPGSIVEKELHEFWRLLDNTLDEVITAGKKPFNPDLLFESLQTYNDHFVDYFGNHWEDPRALLYVQKVIGYEGIQRIMPVNYVQAYRDCLNSTVKKLQNNQPQARVTQFKIYRSELQFYPLQPRGSAGFNFGLFGGPYLYRQCSIGRNFLPQFFKDYVNQKQQAGKTYTTAPRLSG